MHGVSSMAINKFTRAGLGLETKLSDNMTIEIKKNAEATIIEVAGRLDTMTASSLDKAINEDIGEVKHLVLDLKNLEYISSAGLRVILGAQKKMQKIGSMKVINVREEVMEVFEMTGFADILVIE